MDEKEKDQLEKSILECCERNSYVLKNGGVDFLKDLVETFVKNTKTPYDDMVVLPVTEPVFNTINKWLDSQIDKIDGVKGNLTKDPE